MAAPPPPDTPPPATQPANRLHDGRPNPIVTGPHYDVGPEDRYATPYQPITYNQSLAAPLPGLAYCYEPYDWDGDGLIDLVALVRRGAGIVVYQNIGTPQQPRFRSLHDNQTLMGEGRLERSFALADFTGSGNPSILIYERPDEPPHGHVTQARGSRLVSFTNTGSHETPTWEFHDVDIKDIRPEGTQARIHAADWDGDGKPDLLICTFNENDALPPDTERRGGTRFAGFHDPSKLTPHIGKIFWAKNITDDADPTAVIRFAPPQPIEAGGRPIEDIFVLGYPAALDMGDPNRPHLLPHLLIGAQDATIRFYENIGEPGAPRLAAHHPLSDERDEPIRTPLAVQVKSADIDGDGHPELITTGYFGNAGRYTVYKRDFTRDDLPLWQGWRDVGPLTLDASPNTPVYGMGNSTIDIIDFDGDGGDDLLLGAEPGLPIIVRQVGIDDAGQRIYDEGERLKYIDGSPLITYAIEHGEGSYWGPPEWYSDRLAPRAADWDGDGTLDLITGSMGRRLYFLKGRRVNGELRFERAVNFRRDGRDLVVPDRLFPAVLDWTGDGRLDVMISDDDGRVLVYPGDGTLDLGEPIALHHADGQPLQIKDYWDRTKGNRSGFAVADWTGDGHRDLIIYMFHRGVFLFRNRGDDTFEQPELLVKLYSHLAGPMVFDWDGDGVLDLVIGGDERRMIEPRHPAHLAVFHGQDLPIPPGPR